MYLADHGDRFPCTGDGWWITPLIDFPVLMDRYLSTNNRAVYLCPLDTGVNFSVQLATVKGPERGRTAADIGCPTSYYYYDAFFSKLSPTNTPAPTTAPHTARPASTSSSWTAMRNSPATPIVCPIRRISPCMVITTTIGPR